jgi:beta-glucanase (GH16 family)
MRNISCLTLVAAAATVCSVNLPASALAGSTAIPTCSGNQAAPTSPPAQAKAAGFTSLVFDDEFNSASTISPNNTGNYNWYTYDYYGASLQLPASGYQVKTGCLTILTDASGFSSGLSTINSANPTSGTFQTGYFEARIQFNPTGSQGSAWPAFWSYAVQALQGADQFAELDFMEAYPWGPGGATNGYNGVTLLTTIHQWFATSGGNYSLQNDDIPPIPAGFNYNAFHIYGCLWTADSIVWYIDNIAVMTVPIGSLTSFTAIQQNNMFLILGTGKNWPTTYDYVHVWGKPH